MGGVTEEPRSERAQRRADAKVKRLLPERTETVTSRSLALALADLRRQPGWARMTTREMTEVLLDSATVDPPRPPEPDSGGAAARLGLSAEQTAILRKHLASRQQTLAEFLGDVLMDLGLGRATGKDYPTPVTAAAAPAEAREEGPDA